METFKVQSETKATAQEVDAVLELKKDFLKTEISDIVELKALAGVDLSSIDNELLPKVLKRGPAGLLMMDGKLDVIERQVERWSIYFSESIDDLLKAVELIHEYPNREYQSISYAYEAARNILGALEQALMNNGYK